MKKIMQWIARFTRVTGGLFAAVLMLVGATAAAKRLRGWVRSRKNSQ